jgi:hypothetical protein
MHKPSSLSAVLLLTALFAIPSFASSFTFAGSFTQDDNILEYVFTISAGSTVTLESFSYGGNGTTVNPGGFAPVLSLFGPVTSSDPNLINDDDGGTAPGGCGTRLVDPVTHECLDADLTEVLSPGTYLVVLTENDNTPNGPDLLSGFNEMGNGDFTGTNAGLPGDSFLNPGNNLQRTPNYDFTISGVDNALQLPEPSTMSLLIAGLGLLAGVRARQKR